MNKNSIHIIQIIFKLCCTLSQLHKTFSHLSFDSTFSFNEYYDYTLSKASSL